MKIAILSATVGAACAFTPSAPVSFKTSLSMSEEGVEPVMMEVAEPEPEPVVPAVAPINGWVPDESKPCYGLPGIAAPLGFFDPVGFTNDMDLNGVKRFREAEVLHGRVAMMATVGYLIGENTPTIAYGMNTLGNGHSTIANNQIPEVPGIWLFAFFLTINITEALRASTGWVEPGLGPLFSLRETYYPGDIKFDPLGLKPKDAEEFANMATKELNNGRLAMIAAAGMCAQEQVNGEGILQNLGDRKSVV